MIAPNCLHRGACKVGIGSIPGGYKKRLTLGHMPSVMIFFLHATHFLIVTNGSAELPARPLPLHCLSVV